MKHDKIEAFQSGRTSMLYHERNPQKKTITYSPCRFAIKFIFRDSTPNFI